MPSPAPPRGASAISTSAPVPPSALAVSASVLAGTSAMAEKSGCSGCQLQLPDGQAVAVGRGQRDRVALDLHADAGEHRQRVVPAGGHGDLADGRGEHVAAHRPAAGGMVGSDG